MGLLSRCDPTNKLQTWKYKLPTVDPPLDQLWMAPCNVSDPAQQLGFVGGQGGRGGSGELLSKLTGKCLDKAVSMNGQAAKFSACVQPPPIGEAGKLDPTSGHILIGEYSYRIPSTVLMISRFISAKASAVTVTQASPAVTVYIT